MEKQALAVREQQWYQAITTAKQSGQSIKSWCAENGVPLSSFYSVNLGGVYITVNGYNARNDDELAQTVADKINGMIHEDDSVFK